MSERIVFRKRADARPTWTLVFRCVAALVFLGGVGLLVLFFIKLLLIEMYKEGMADPGGLDWVVLVAVSIAALIFGAFGLACIGILILYWSYAAWRVNWPEEPLIISPVGIRDARLSDEVLPWDVLATRMHFEYGPLMEFDTVRLRRCNLNFSGKLAIRFPMIKRTIMNYVTLDVENAPGVYDAMLRYYPGEW